jgi:hypothetical protein
MLQNIQILKMARGGGTGARNKAKKKSDTVISNGGTATTTTNGILESDKKFTDTKVNKQRKLMVRTRFI